MQKFYITTPIFYVNASPHIGHAYTDVAADVFARWARKCGRETFFLTGTDEHGAKIVRAAQRDRVPLEKFVNGRRAEFQDLLALLNISNEDFIFTRDEKRHWPGVFKIWNQIRDRGDLYKATYKGLYCVGHEAFVTEKDLVGGQCADHNEKPEVIEEENYFFRLSKYAKDIEQAIKSGELNILPVSRRNEVLAFIKEGVEDVSFSRPRRDLEWGIPVPDDPDHTIYVWADALTNYISALGYGTENGEKFKKFWPAQMHLIGKDILRFHAIIWPGILMSAGLPLPKTIYVHGIIRSGGQKMSKTIGNVINPHDLVKVYSADAFRYFLMREIPFGEDGDFTIDRFGDIYEGSLAHGLGNLVARVAAMSRKYFEGTLEKPSAGKLASVPTKRALRQEISKSRFLLEGESLERYFELEIETPFKKAMEACSPTEALTILWGFFSLLDGYVQDYEPYTLIKKDPEKTKLVLWNLASHILKSGELLEPFMPETAGKIREIFLASDSEITVRETQPLFPSRKKE